MEAGRAGGPEALRRRGRSRSTRAVHGGGKPRGGLALPIHPASVYAFDSLAETIEALEGSGGPVYSRYGHPTGSAVEAHLASLQGTEGALLFASGMAAIGAVVLSTCGSGDHLLASSEIYGGTYGWLRSLAGDLGIEVEFLRLPELAGIGDRVRERTRLVLVESPTNPLARLVDFEAFFAALGERRPVTAIDATLSTPLGQDPVGAGFDLVLHSATKYLGGHDDLLAGVVCGPKKLLATIEARRHSLGSICDPFTAWLLGRGIKTLAVRWERQCANALALARRLEAHPGVTRVHYPGLPSHPHHELAQRQFADFGAILAFEPGPDRESARRVIEGFHLVARAPSLGGVETACLHAATASHRALSEKERASVGIGEGLVRLSVGIEDVEDLWEDLEGALAGGG